MNSVPKKDTKTEESNVKNCEVDTDKPIYADDPYDEYEKKTYFFKEKYINESNAFTKYYEAIKNNGFILNIINEVENMGDYCDLFTEVSKVNYNEPINLFCDPIPANERSEDILYASQKLKLIDTPDKGRSLIANSGIPKNKVLIYEYPTILQVKPVCTCVGDNECSLYRCHNCGTACKIFYTCDGCNICIFCSRACLLNAYKNYHRYECYGLQRHFWSMDDTDYSYLSLRMMLYGASKQFETDPVVGSGYGSFENNYPFIHKLETNFEQLSLTRINEILYSSVRNLIYLISKTTFFYQFKGRNCKLYDLYLYIGGLMVKHYCQAQTNNILLTYTNLPAGFGLNVISGSGKAICPTIALLNHSCSPNAAIVIYNDIIVVKSLKSIKKGEEIMICYSEINAFLSLSERQMITEEIFNFVCNCCFCDYEKHWMESPYKCTLCTTGKAVIVDVDDNKTMGFCSNCEKYFSLEKINENLKIITICRNLYSATYSVDHVTRIAECYSNIFPTKSWFLLDVYKLLYEKHIIWEAKPLEAIKYGLLSFNILEQYISRLYLPILISKVRFVISIIHMDTFLEISNVTGQEFETMRIFVGEVMKIKEDLLFYLSDERIYFHRDLLVKVHNVFESIQTKSC